VNRFAFVTAALLAAFVPSTSRSDPPPAQPQAEDQKLQQLLDEEWEWSLRDEPTFATRLGDPRYNDRWPDHSLEAFARRRVHAQERLEKIKAIDRAKLTSANQLNYDLFLRNSALRVEEMRFHGEYLPISQRYGPHSEVAELVNLTPLKKSKDYQDLVRRLRSYPQLIDQDIALMRKGLEAGIVPPRIILRSVAEQMRNQIAADPKNSPVFQSAFRQVPESIPAAEQQRWREEVATALREAVMPAIQKLQVFFSWDYEPKARASIAMSDLPDGAAWYALRIKVMTTTDLTADQIHELGLSEVKRLRGEMEKAMRQSNFRGDLQAFFHFLRTDPRFFFKDKAALLMTYRDIAKRVDPELTRLFRTLPRSPYGVIPVPAYSEKTQTTAYYQPGSLEAGRPGYFYANTYDLKSRPKWEMEALTLHEAVPGHHLQIAIAQELPEVPQFRRHGFYTAFVEGWGLYAESLGSEIGFYQDPYSKFGQLTYEMWRAIRLVVDTGMHTKGWTRDQALRFFQQNAGKTQHDIEVEVDRYISWGGQALAYKLGELKIKELRAFASQQLGEAFDLRDFHDQVLGAGPLPLSILEVRIRQWVAARAASKKQASN
jgi:uncharacterized protein (DUF885 family)